MTEKKRGRLFGAMLRTGAAAGIAYLVARQRARRWGATDAEVMRVMPGDALVPNPKVGYTQAITIYAPPEKVWPWLVQIGYKRGGWYTYDWFYDLTKSGDFVDGHSANRIVPDLQTLSVGDVIHLHPQAPMTITELIPNQALVLQAKEVERPETFFINMSWSFLLEPLGQATRLITRNRTDSAPYFPYVLLNMLFADGGAIVMQPKMLEGIKVRAERN